MPLFVLLRNEFLGLKRAFWWSDCELYESELMVDDEAAEVSVHFSVP